MTLAKNNAMLIPNLDHDLIESRLLLFSYLHLFRDTLYLVLCIVPDMVLFSILSEVRSLKWFLGKV